MERNPLYVDMSFLVKELSLGLGSLCLLLNASYANACEGLRLEMARVYGWEIYYPEIGYPEFCQLIEQKNLDPNKALGQGMKITVYLDLAF